MASLFMTRKEACEMLGIGDKTFSTLTIPFYKIGKRQKYKVDDIEEYLNKQREGAKCRSAKGRVRLSIGMISRSEGLDFAEVVRQARSHSLHP